MKNKGQPLKSSFIKMTSYPRLQKQGVHSYQLQTMSFLSIPGADHTTSRSIISLLLRKENLHLEVSLPMVHPTLYKVIKKLNMCRQFFYIPIFQETQIKFFESPQWRTASFKLGFWLQSTCITNNWEASLWGSETRLLGWWQAIFPKQNGFG